MLDESPDGLAAFFGKGDKTTAAFDAIRPRTRLFANQRRVQLVDDLVGFLTRFVEQAHIGRIANIGRSTRGVGDQLAAILARFRDTLGAVFRPPRFAVVILSGRPFWIIMGRFYGHRRRFFPRQRSQRNRFANPLHALFAKTLTEIDHQRGVKRIILRELFAAKEELQVRVLPDRFDRFAIGQSQSLLDNQRTKSHSCWNDRCARIFAQIGMVNLLCQFPRHQPC